MGCLGLVWGLGRCRPTSTEDLRRHHWSWRLVHTDAASVPVLAIVTTRSVLPGVISSYPIRLNTAPNPLWIMSLGPKAQSLKNMSPQNLRFTNAQTLNAEPKMSCNVYWSLRVMVLYSGPCCSFPCASTLWESVAIYIGKERERERERERE